MGKLMLASLLWLLGGNYFYPYFFEKSSANIENAISRKMDKEGSFNVSYLNKTYSLHSDSTQDCNQCHAELLTGENSHAPAKKDCMRCHASNGMEHPKKGHAGFSLSKKVPDLCYECHDAKNDQDFVHEPSGKGDCLLCHNPHSSDNLYLVKSDPVSDICYKCHDLKIEKNSHVHGAVSEGKCTGCHNPHQASNEKFIANTNLERLCKGCHSGIKGELRSEHVHDPFLNKKCFSCHNAHSSKEPHLLDFKTDELCYSCHKDMHAEVKNAKITHGVLKDSESCIACHSPHGTDFPQMQKMEKVELCLNCHSEHIKTDNGKLESIGAKLKTGNTIHTIISTDGCIACHNSHVSEEIRLLNNPYTKGTYVSSDINNFSFCFTCHKEELLSRDKGKQATNFRNGTQNLHALHINGEKGRNCSVCHDVHGSENQFLIKSTTQFGNWNMPVTFKLFDDGASCLTGCHAEYRYKREAIDSQGIIKK